MGVKDIDYDTIIRLYWNTEPAWSGLDLAKYFDCGNSSIYKFMEKHGIPRRNQSDAHINAWRCEWKKENLLDGIVKLWSNPEFREKQSKISSEASKEQWKDPEFQKLMSKIHKEKWNNPEYREKMVEVGKNLWKNPEFRAKRSEERSKLMKENWKNPKFREAMIKRNTEIWNEPEYRRHLTEITKKAYHDNPNHPLRIRNERNINKNKKKEKVLKNESS
ncbi:hypothetical protein LCGC14_2636100 [marine sediment metagenome]|uniref:Uncharacterized protein n=1 Tax=marine sediment metagenome TaxID=412755 RepID=A0A0F9C9Q8_9ZZZZ